MNKPSLACGLLVTLSLSAGCTVRSARHHAAAPPAPVWAANSGSARFSAGATLPCAQVEVAPGVFRSTDCEQRPKMASSRFVQSFRLPMLRGPRGLQPISRAQLPAEVDLRASNLDGPVRDQEQVGVCWSMAMSSVVDNGLRRAGIEESAAPLHLIVSDAYQRMHATGQSAGFTQEATWKYDPVRACKLKTKREGERCGQYYSVEEGSWRQDPKLVAEERRASNNPNFRIVHAEAVASPELIAAALAQGREAYLGLSIDREIWGYKNVQAGVVPDYTDTNAGHAVTAVGYRTLPDGERQFLLKNSWGKGWGTGGYAWIHEATLARNLQDAFVFEVVDPAGKPFPQGNLTPTREPDPAPAQRAENGCQNGLSRDLVFGACLPTCGDGSAPLAGLCLPSKTSSASSSSCPAGQTRDVLSGRCVQRCPSGLSPVAGVCWAG